MEDLIKNLFYSGIGLASMASDKIEEVIDELTEKGNLSEGEGKKIVDDFVKQTEEKRKEFEEKFSSTFESFTGPIKDLIKDLEQKGKETMENHAAGESDASENKEEEKGDE